ncbi:MAG: hypothetical protein ACXV2F_07400 [Halobacteriota archaeon]
MLLNHDLREGMFRPSFRTCGKAEDICLGEGHVASIAADDIGDDNSPLVSVPVLRSVVVDIGCSFVTVLTAEI